MGENARLIQEFRDWSADAHIREFSKISQSHRLSESGA